MKVERTAKRRPGDLEHAVRVLLLNPIDRSDVLVGKRIAVTVFAAGALGLNIVGLVVES